MQREAAEERQERYARENTAEWMRLGRRLEERPPKLGGVTIAQELAERYLRVRGREGGEIAAGGECGAAGV